MTLVTLRTVPRDARGWEKFHWNHFLDHKIILGVLNQKIGATFLIQPIWPVPRNVYTAKLAEWHQYLHDQMDTFAGINSSDMTEVDLSTLSGATQFVTVNYRDHLRFHDFVGVPT